MFSIILLAFKLTDRAELYVNYQTDILTQSEVMMNCISNSRQQMV